MATIFSTKIQADLPSDVTTESFLCRFWEHANSMWPAGYHSNLGKQTLRNIFAATSTKSRVAMAEKFLAQYPADDPKFCVTDPLLNTDSLGPI
jgi:hypothetical protein